MKPVTCYIDYKSPYAYLALDELCDLEDSSGSAFTWLPYTLDIPDYLGSATLDDDGTVIQQDRSPHQWRKVRYAYMDVRRYANRKGLTIRGTTKIWDSSLAGMALLWINRFDDPMAVRRFNMLVFERFWRRDLDIENPAVVTAVLEEAEISSDGFGDYLAGPGRVAHDAVCATAEDQGVFGVPSLMVGDELFWGREHLALVAERLEESSRSD